MKKKYSHYNDEHYNDEHMVGNENIMMMRHRGQLNMDII